MSVFDALHAFLTTSLPPGSVAARPSCLPSFADDTADANKLFGPALEQVKMSLSRVVDLPNRAGLFNLQGA